MKRVPFYLVAMILAIAGCSTPGSPDGDSLTIDEIINRSESPDINDAFGGFNMKDEAPAFGDERLASEFGPDPGYDDPFASAPEVLQLEAADREPVLLMITWGNLHRDSTVTGWTDWSGSLRVAPGIIVVRRAIRLEAGDMIQSRVSRDLLEWQSRTQLGVDGVLVKIHATPPPAAGNAAAGSSVDSSAVTITFATSPVTVEFTLDQLPNLERVITLDDGNAVAFTAVRIAPGGCPAGFMRGEWRNHPERQGGILCGRWATADGQIRGHIRGIYGSNDAGEKVFFAKMIDANGRFEGIVRGRYENRPDLNGGWYAGRWVGRNLEVRGVMKGEWRQSERCHGGFFRGLWVVDCLNVM